MPGFDGTGPMGQGPGTGRAAGYCPPGPPKYVNPPQFFGRGFGRGFGGGRGKGFGRGFGFYPHPYGYYPAAYEAYPYKISPEEEMKTLRAQASSLEEEMKQVHKRIDELRQKETPKS